MKKNRFNSYVDREMFVGRVCSKLLDLAGCNLLSIRVQFQSLGSIGLSDYFGKETLFSPSNPHHLSCLFAYLSLGCSSDDDVAFSNWKKWCDSILSL